MYLDDRFFSKVNYSEKCWMWNAGKSSFGYGRFKINGTTKYAHRVSYEYFRGKIRDFVLHHCDNPSCVNPFHLYDGTMLQNNKDMNDRGRNAQSLKTHCPNGHLYDSANTYINAGSRACRKCRRKGGEKINVFDEKGNYVF